MLGDNLNNILDIEFIVKNNKVINNNSFNSIFINDIKNYIISISYLLWEANLLLFLISFLTFLSINFTFS